MEKRGILLLLLLLIPILLLVNVSAKASCAIKTMENCTEEGVVVMGLSGDTNAHGQFYELQSYDYALCCDDDNLGPSCDPNLENKIIGLSSGTNAHAEIKELTEYTVDVCYEDIECKANTSSSVVITSTWNEILSLSSETDAHIGGPGDYDIGIHCNVDYWGTYCGDGVVQPTNDLGQDEECDLGDDNCNGEDCVCYTNCTFTPYNLEKRIHWAEEESETYPPLEKKDVIVGTTKVYMRVENAVQYGVSVNDAVKFEIYEKDTWAYGGGGADDDIRTGADAIVGTWDGNGNVVAEWTISQSDIDATEDDYEEFYFKTNVSGTEEKSGYLNLSVSNVFDCSVVNLCGDYTTQSDCQADANLCNVGPYNVHSNNPDLNCTDDEIVCTCAWNENTGVCEPDWWDNNGHCSYNTIIDDDCEDGFLYYTFEATWTGNETGDYWEKCADGQSTVPCPSQIQLTGFDVINIILIVALLVLIYWSISLKKKRKGTPKKEKKNKKVKTKSKKPVSKKKKPKKSSKKSNSKKKK